jgi:two-component system chemotaxis response regulator CheY
LSRLLQVVLTAYGDFRAVADGEAAVYAFVQAWRQRRPYDLICMDIMMPKMNGIDALKHIRHIEESNGIPVNRRVKVIMLTGLDDTTSVTEAFFEGGATAYLVKPLDKNKLIKELENLNLLHA